MLPESTSHRDAISFAMVDFPLPEGPTIAFTVPYFKTKDGMFYASVMYCDKTDFLSGEEKGASHIL